jgi:early secretory antigenic target protein ESAT-6
MGFDGIKVDHGALDEASQNLLTAAKNIDGRLNTLEDELKPLRENWTGSAKESYAVAKQTWDQAIAEMILLLQDVGNAVSMSNGEYKSADQRGASRFS